MRIGIVHALRPNIWGGALFTEILTSIDECLKWILNHKEKTLRGKIYEIK